MKRVLLLLAGLFISVALSAQNDTLILTNGDIIVGDLKSMEKGVLVIEPPYSDSDFKIEWEGVKSLKATQRYLIRLSSGERINGTMKSTGDGQLMLIDEDGKKWIIDPNEVVYANSINDSFLSRLSANVDLGYSLTKANNQQQLNANFRIGYLADLWSLNMYYNSLLTKQDDIEDIQRNDGGLEYRYFLPADWYLSANLTFLSNTEQSLALRTTGKLGAGHYVIHSNASYWGFSGGLAFNSENFSPILFPDADSSYTTPNRNSLESYLGTELNLYDIGDLNLLTNLIVYPSLTESGRVRADFKFDAKYSDFLLDDFYIRAGFTLNYDNRPAEVGRETDYIFTTGFGWEW